MQISGAQLFVKALKSEQVDTLFAYPGGQAIDLFDALYGEKEIEVILPRHEQGLVHAADGYARSTGKTGVCLVTSGPGAANLVTGIATANYDSVPLVCFTGQVPTGLIGNGAFQEVNIVDIVKSICKHAVMVKRREDLGEIIRKAFIIARTGKPGVVVVDLPKDIQKAQGNSQYPIRLQPEMPDSLPADFQLTGQIKKAAGLLNAAKKPVVLAGGGVNIARAGRRLTELAEKTGIPVVTTIMGKGAIPSGHPLYAGNIGIHGSFAANSAVSECDVLLAVGTRFNDRITGRPEQFARRATVIHMDIDSSFRSKKVTVDVPVDADVRKALPALADELRPLSLGDWKAQLQSWERQHPVTMKPEGLTPQFILEAVNRVFTKAIIAADVGQNQLWATQFLDLNEDRQLLTSGGMGTMGYGLPAAIGASLGNPGKDVVVIAGDGGIQMNIQEMATAVVYELPLVICILNNGCLGNVRQWQEMFYGKRYSSTCMRFRRSCPADCSSPLAQCPAYTPDFIRLAESYGAKGVRVCAPSEAEAALRCAKQEKRTPTVIEFIIEREENVLPIVPAGNALDDMIFENVIL